MAPPERAALLSSVTKLKRQDGCRQPERIGRRGDSYGGVIAATSPDGADDEPAQSAVVADASALIVSAAVNVRRALVARNGLADGCDAAAEAVAWAWEHQRQLSEMSNPVGYLYRVGQSSLRRRFRHDRLRVDVMPERVVEDRTGIDHELFEALRRLTPDQRQAVVMVHMYAFTYREVAEVIGSTEAAVTNYVHRGMKRLRRLLTEGNT